MTSISYQRHCDDMTNITDITYGIPAEVWPR
ncbi:TPA: transcriptional regulator, partial [Citrobacter freundii]|nr:transcriptional regulator [Citrobacter freundii]